MGLRRMALVFGLCLTALWTMREAIQEYMASLMNKLEGILSTRDLLS